MKYKPIDEFEDHKCDMCPLHEFATHVKIKPRYGRGDIKLLLIGEAPGQEEDERGQAFIGNSGKKLDRILHEAGIPIDNVGITNVVRCAPWKDPLSRGRTRTPDEDEVYSCIRYAFDEIHHVDPDVIVSLGNIATKFLLGIKGGITKMRGRVFKLDMGHKEYSVIPTFHPASILHGAIRNEPDMIRDLKKAWGVANGGRDFFIPQWELVNDDFRAIEILQSVISDFKSGDVPYAAYDIESVDLDPYQGKMRLLGISVAPREHEGYFIPLFHKESRITVGKIAPHLQEFFETVEVVGHNIKFDYIWTKYNLGYDLKVRFDTLLASSLIYGDTRSNDLGSLSQDLLSYPDYEAELRRFLESLPKDQRNYGNIPLKLLGPYGATDAAATRALAPIFMERIKTEELDFPYTLVHHALGVFTEIEINGWRIDIDELHRLQEYYPQRYDAYLKKFFQTRGCRWFLNRVTDQRVREILDSKSFPNNIGHEKLNLVRRACNPNSHNQMRSIIFEFYKSQIIDITGVNQLPSTNEKTVLTAWSKFSQRAMDSEQISDPAVKRKTVFKYQDAKKFMEYLWVLRSIQNAGSKYLNKLPQHIRPASDILSFSYNITGTVTGRFSTSDFAIHTTPRESDVKRLFIAPWDYGLVLDGDYSQWEMRIMALEAGDDGMLKAFEEGYDIYKYVASKLFNREMEKVTKEERQLAKSVGLGIIYGRGPNSIAEVCQISVDEAKALIEEFFRRFPRIRDFVERCHEEIKTTGKIRTRFNRIRHFPSALRESEITWREKGEIERAAQNFPIQSLASDLTLIALFSIHEEFMKQGLHSKVLGFVHDGIPAAVYQGELFKVLDIFQKSMSTRLKEMFPWLDIPIKTGFKTGRSWGGALKVVQWSPDGILFLSGKKRFYDQFKEAIDRTYEYREVSYEEEELKDEMTEYVMGEAYLGLGSGNVNIEAELEFAL